MSRIAFREHAHKGQIPGVKNRVGKIKFRTLAHLQYQ